MKKFGAPAGMAVLFVVSQLIAIFVAPSFKEAGFETFENPNDPLNIVYIFFIILIFTLIILLIAKYRKNLVKYIILLFFFLTAFTIFQAFFYSVDSPSLTIEEKVDFQGGKLIYTIWVNNTGNKPVKNVVVSTLYHENFTFISSQPANDTGFNNRWTLTEIRGGESKVIYIKGERKGNNVPPIETDVSFAYESTFAILSAFIISVVMLFLLVKYPEWYVIDTFGIFLAGGISAIFAISLSIELILLFLIALAIYDAVSVYKTKHMVKLAETAVSSHLPLLMIFPKKASYSYLRDKWRDERDAVYMGLGDIVIPGILITASYLEYGLTGFILTLLGALIGYILLMTLISKGPQPGLPYLNGGVIVAYVILHFL